MNLQLLIFSFFIIFSCEKFIEIEDCAGIVGGTAELDCAGKCGGSSIEDLCGVCDGAGSTCEIDGEWIIYYQSSNSIGGFQFNVEGVTVMDAYGGAAGAAGFSISSSATTVLGFSLTGANISIGEGLLVVLDVVGATSAGCLENVIISDSSGNALDTIVENCNIIHVSE